MGKFIQTHFFYFFTFSLPTKQIRDKIKYFLSSHFSILSPFSVLSFFHSSNQTDFKRTIPAPFIFPKLYFSTITHIKLKEFRKVQLATSNGFPQTNTISPCHQFGAPSTPSIPIFCHNNLPPKDISLRSISP